MIDIYICEDQPEQLAAIRKKIDNIIVFEQLDMKIVSATANPDEIIKAARKSANCGLYFLDIDLNRPDMDGFVLAQKIRDIEPRCFIVFITSHSECSHLTYEYKLEALDYIIKDDISHISSRIRQCIFNAYKKHIGGEVLHKGIYHTQLYGDRDITVKYEDIVCFETAASAHKIILRTAQRQIEFSEQLNNIEGQLPENFLRCHRSYIINVQNIKHVNFQYGQATMRDGSVIPISVRRRGILKQMLATEKQNK